MFVKYAFSYENALERFSIECRKTKTKVIAQPITKDINKTVNQSKLEVITSS